MAAAEIGYSLSIAFATVDVMMEYPVSTAVTTSAPTKTARPVETVRFGERNAFATANFPVWLRKTEPRTRTRGRRSHGVSIKTAMPSRSAAIITRRTEVPAFELSLFCVMVLNARIMSAPPPAPIIRPAIRPAMFGFLTA